MMAKKFGILPYLNVCDSLFMAHISLNKAVNK